MRRRSYAIGHSHRRFPLRILYLLIILIIAIVIGEFWVHRTYNRDLSPVSSSQKTQIFTVAEGSSVKQISSRLQQQHLIRSTWAFELYVHSKDLNDKLQAGTYALSPAQGIDGIVTTLTKGRVSTELVTIVPGSRIDQVRADLINDGFSPADVDNALNPAQYANLPVMAYKPADANSLEGLLWPDSWYKDSSSTASDIITDSLTAMGQHLTPDVQAAFAAENLTVYQGLTLTSIINQEVSKPADQTQVAQVFLSRLKSGMPLGSDVTADYGAIVAGQTPSLNYDSPYNTLIHTGLPPTPISTISQSALQAATHPAGTSWLYFVTGDNGTTYFSNTLQQQQANTQQYCHKLCSQ